MPKEYEFISREIKSKRVIGKEPITIPDGEEPKEYILKIIQRFNDTLRPHEKARELVEILGATGIEYCDFEKQNSFTIQGSDYSTFDIYRCKKCNLRVQAFGLSGSPSRMKCKPELLCNECNKYFKTESGLKKHNEKDRHKTPSWLNSTR